MIQEKMQRDLSEKTIFEQARDYAFSYIDGINAQPVTPTEEALKLLDNFDENMPAEPIEAAEVLSFLQANGSVNTVAQNAHDFLDMLMEVPCQQL